MNIKGTIKLINETQTFDSGFTKREFVVTTKEQYPQDISIEVVKDKTTLLDSFKVGDAVDVAINIRGNEYNGRYYVNIQGWKIDKLGETFEGVTTPAMQEAMDKLENVAEADDLPF